MTRVRLLLVAAMAAALASPLGAARATDGSCQPDVEGVSASPYGGVVCEGMGARPGAVVDTPTGTCTLNFVFEGSDGHRYIGTAGHCILLKYGGDRRTWPVGHGPPVKIDKRRAGEIAYADFWGSRDFALIRLDPDFPWSPAVMHFGGPTGMYADHAGDPIGVHHTGNGLVIGNLFNHWDYGVGPQDIRPLAARTGVALDTYGYTEVYMHAAADWGDSGSGVITADGRALGTLVAISTEPDLGTAVATRLDYSVYLAELTLGITLTLQTAPLRTAGL